MKFRIDFELDKFKLLRLAEHFIYNCNQNNLKLNKVSFERYVKLQLLNFGLNNNLDEYKDLTRQAMLFLVKKYKIKFW